MPEIIADLHIHSKYARACSKFLELENIEKYCRIKGVGIIVTGDVTHPGWFSDIKNKLVPHTQGFFKLKGSDGKVHFVLGTELSCIYRRFGKVRRIHVNVLFSNIKSVEKFIIELEKRGCNLKADGRPILGLDVEELTKICFDCDEKAFVFPAHIWTPWFALFGSKSGFDHIGECFGSMTKHIYAYETGISSDPDMNWRVSQLDDFSLISNSDAHSLENIAREANVFDLKTITYDNLISAIKSRDPQRFLGTIEFYPEGGTYHYDGHRACNISLAPNESLKNKLLCPVCKKALTLGVMYRIEQLADRKNGYTDKRFLPFKKLLPLDTIIAQSLGIKSRKSKKVQAYYQNLVNELDSELEILQYAGLNEIAHASTRRIAEGIERVRRGDVTIHPGFDGEYGTITIFNQS